MSDITLELGPSNGDPVDFEVGATAADPVTFDVGPGGTVDLTNYARLDQSNRWTAGPQTIAQDVAHVPFADIATTDLPVHVEAVDTHADPDEPIWRVFSSAVDLGGGTIYHGVGGGLAEIGPDGERTGGFVQMASGPNGLVLNRVDGPSFADQLTAELTPVSVGAPTEDDHAATKEYVDTEVAGAASDAAAALAAEVATLEAADTALAADVADLAAVTPSAMQPHLPAVIVGNDESGGAGCRFQLPNFTWDASTEDPPGLDVRFCAAWLSQPVDTWGEILTHTQDGGGAGVILEIAFHNDGGQVGVYMEMTPDGETAERPSVDTPAGSDDPDWTGPTQGTLEWYRATADFEAATATIWRRVPTATVVTDVVTSDGACWRRLRQVSLGASFTELDPGTFEWWIGYGEGRRAIAVIEVRNGIDGPMLSRFDAADAVFDGLYPVSVHDSVVDDDWVYDPTEFPGRPKTRMVGLDLATQARYLQDGEGGGAASLSDATPQALGTAAAGTGTEAARDDHVHPTTGLALAGHDHSGTYQPLDSDLTALAALSTTSFGRALLELANAAALRTAAGLGTAATADTGTGSGNVILGNDSRLTDTRTPTDASVTTAKLATALANRIPTRVRITSDVGATTTSQVDTTGLSFAVTSGSVYYFTVVLWVGGDTSNDIDVGATFPSGTMRLGFLGPARSGSSTPITSQGDAIITSSGSLTRLGLLTGSDLMVVGHGVFVASANGTVQIRHAKNSNSVTGTASTVKAQSYLEYTVE